MSRKAGATDPTDEGQPATRLRRAGRAQHPGLTEIRPMQLSIDLAVKILSDLLLLTVSVLYRNRPLAALLATRTAAI